MVIAYACSAVIDRLVDMADHRPAGSHSEECLRAAAACVADAARAAGTEDGAPQPSTPAEGDDLGRVELLTATLRQVGSDKIGRTAMAAVLARSSAQMLAELEAHRA